MNLQISMSDTASPTLRRWIDATTGGSSRRGLLEAMGLEVQTVTATHVAALTRREDSLASKLGAPSTGFYKEASEKIAVPAALDINANAATLTINHPGFVRAFRDVTVVPRNAKSLAIPINAISFGRRAADLWKPMNLFIPKGENIIAMSVGKTITALYVLVRSVTQKQDRNLLPSQEEWQGAAERGALDFFKGLKDRLQ